MANLREQRILHQLQDLRIQPHLQVIECQSEGLLRDDLWIVWVKGAKQTIWEGSVIPVTVQFPERYPISPPSIRFPQDFKHVHVYEGGFICLPILQNQYWKPKSSMVDLINRIHCLIHQQINPYSPANNTFYQLYKTNPEQYKLEISKQVDKYRQKQLKYFKMACIHINSLT